MRRGADSMGAMGVALVAIGMLLWALYGHPPYAFYGVMKWVVAGSCAFVGWALWRRSRALAPLCLVLFTVGGIHLFGKMRREEWGMFNWAAIGALAISAGVLMLGKGEVKDSDATGMGA